MDATPRTEADAGAVVAAGDQHPDYRTLPESSPRQCWTETQASDPGRAAAEPFSFSAEHVVDAWTVGG